MPPKHNKNAVSHGVYSLQANGPQGETQLARHAELTKQYQDREGVVNALIDTAVMCTMLRELAMSYIQEERAAGVPFDEIPMSKNIVAYINSERLALLAVKGELKQRVGVTVTDVIASMSQHEQDRE